MQKVISLNSVKVVLQKYGYEGLEMCRATCLVNPKLLSEGVRFVLLI